MHLVERTSTIGGAFGKERLTVKSFRDSDAMYRFLNTGGNGTVWRESNRGLKAGTYAYVGGQWRNVKSLDSLTLAHV